MTEKKAPMKKKAPKIGEIKKTLTVGGIISAIAVVGIIVGIYILSESTQYGGVLYACGYALPYTIDPIDVTDPGDADTINQVAEGLFDIGKNSEIIYNLATDDERSIDGLNLTCLLRQGVKFHDGTPFNASAVKWNIDRAYRLIDNIPFDFLWLLPDGRPIINETIVLEEYTIKFILNIPYAPLRSLLASTYSYMVSPTATPANRFIDRFTESLVGTGPFRFDFYAEDDNVTLSANTNYWDGRPLLDKLIFLRPTKSVEEALKSGEIHIKKDVRFNETTLNYFRNNPSFTVSDPIPFLYRDIILMNNKLINVTMRKAISYAFNYSNYQLSFRYVRAKGPIPEGILYCNTSGIDVPYYNISIARQALKDGNWPGTESLTANDDISPGNPWELVATSLTPLATYNYSACYNWDFSIEYGYRITEDLRQIGVKIEPVNLSIFQWNSIYLELGGCHRDMFELAFDFWIADYNDPSNFINEFYTNKKKGYNAGQFNDTQIQEWMDAALYEIDPNTRRLLYYIIQKHLLEDLFPSVFLNSWTRTDVYVSNLIGWNSHPFKDSFKNVYFK